MKLSFTRKRPDFQQGFTLITLITILASLLLPVLSKVISEDKTPCQLREAA